MPKGSLQTGPAVVSPATAGNDRAGWARHSSIRRKLFGFSGQLYPADEQNLRSCLFCLGVQVAIAEKIGAALSYHAGGAK